MKSIKDSQIINEIDSPQEFAFNLTKGTQPKVFPIIAMGGSAGSFQSFEQFFLHMPVDTGYVFVIVMHLQVEHKVDTAALLQRFTALTVIKEAEELTRLNNDLKMFNFRKFEVKEQYFLEIVHNRWNTTKLDTLLFNPGSDTELYMQHDFQGIGMKKLIVNVQYVSENKFNEHAAVIVTFKPQ